MAERSRKTAVVADAPAKAILDGPSEVTILDVGHGNATVVRSAGDTLVIDAALGRVLLDELIRTSTTRVEHLVLSHTDRDHIGGAAALLSGTISIGTLWFNSDATKASDTFADLRQLAYELNRAGRLAVSTQLDNTIGDALSIGSIDIAVVHPNLLSSATGPRPRDHPDGEISANQMSAVVRIARSSEDRAHVLLAGDLDAAGLEEMLGEGADIRARVLVFPHHGGRSGGDDAEFARRLVAAVAPDVVVFSMGRGVHANPRPEIVAATRAAAPLARIACTQLSVHCAPAPLTVNQSYLLARPAAGLRTSSCCSGTLVIPLSDDAVEPTLAAHREFISEFVPRAMCLASSGEVSA
jgi:beta-lactamase superfamily II metal-dependent hydrolase